MTEQSPLERAARVLCQDALMDHLANNGMTDDEFVGKYWPDFVEPARAVLMAIREPSEAMCQAARDAKFDVYRDGKDHSTVPRWEAMIDAASDERTLRPQSCYNLVIGNNAALNLIWANYCLIIGEDQCRNAVTLPDNFVSIKGVFEGVIDNPLYRNQMRVFLSRAGSTSNHEFMIFVVNLCKEIGIDYQAVAKLLSEIFTDA